MDPLRAVQILLPLIDGDESDQVLELLAISATINEEVPKVKNFINVINAFNDDQFQKHFRLKKSTCEKLIEMFGQSDYCPKNTFGPLPKSPEAHIYSFIWFAANKATLRRTSLLFDMAISTLHEVVKRVIQFLYDIAPLVIRFPKNDHEKEALSQEFDNVSRFPGVVGCLDGSYIKIRTPAHKTPSDYVNRHHYTSMTLQGICDSKKKFLDCFTGVPSKCHDRKIYSLSFVKPLVDRLGIDYRVVGDAAYPLATNLMTPYKNYGNLTADEKNYNTELSRARVKIENAFALLKSRFRHLMQTDFFQVQKTAHFIIACCVLHNLAIDDDGLFLSQDEINAIKDFLDNNQHVQQNVQNRNIGAAKRDEIRDEL